MLPSITIKITLGERTIVIRKNGQFRLNGISGAESPQYDVQAEEYSAQPGGYLTAEHVQTRLIDITFTVDERRKSEELRQELISFFSIDRVGELEITRTGVTRKIPCRCGSAPVFSQANMRQDRLKVSITLLCLSPYFQATEPVNITFGESIPLMMFPLTLFPKAGMTVGMPGITDTATLNNDGHVGSGLTMTVKAVGGTVVNPSFSLDREYVRVLTTLYEGDVLEIDTRTGRKSVKVNGENRLIFDHGSVFFSCPPGRHTLRFDAESGKENARSSAEIIYQYNGV